MCGNKNSFTELVSLSATGNLTCLGYLCVVYSYGRVIRRSNINEARKLARQIYPRLLRLCTCDEERQYLALNKHQLFILGVLFSRGLGCHRSAVEAFHCFRLASFYDFSPALHHLGLLYEYGVGVSKDLSKASELQQQSAALGDPMGQYFYASHLLSGWGYPRNYSLAFYYYYLSAHQGYRPAVHLLFTVFLIVSGILLAILWFLLLVTYSI